MMRSMLRKAVAITTSAILLVAGVTALTVPAHAAATLPFKARFTANANGAIIAIGNVLLTCPTTGAAPVPANCDAAKKGGAFDNNNFNMINLNADVGAGTTNSSMSTLSLPPGATVLWAGLYWGARSPAATTPGINQMSLKLPGAASYTPITADLSTIVDGQPVDATFGPNTSSSNAYQRFKDVTTLVRQGGNGDYWGANVTAATGSDRYAGWALVVAYSAPGLPLRNLTVFDGFNVVQNGSPVTVNISGFQAPKAGPVDAQLSMVTYEGDLTLTGDYVRLNNTQLASTLSQGSNFFNSTNDLFGTSTTTRNPADRNMLGFDIKNIGASGIIPNNATSASFYFYSTGDVYYPGVVATSINLYAPDFTASSKTVVNLSGNNPARPGDILQYTANFVNTGQDPADSCVSYDMIPPNTAYVPGSLRLADSFGNPGASLSDGADGDVGEFTGDRVRVRLGTGASGTAGGTLGVGASQAYIFQVQVLDSAANTTITNTAHLDYITGTTKLPLSYDTAQVANPVVPLADVAITKTMTDNPTANGDTITATLVITNNGPQTAQGVTVTDQLENWLNVDVDTTQAPGAVCTINLPNAAGQNLSCTLPDMALGATPTIVITGNMAPDTPTSVTSLINTARVLSTTFDPDLSNNTDSDVIQLTQAADLAIVKTANKASVVPGETVTYTMTVTNNGPSEATNITISDTLFPTAVGKIAIVSATAPDGSCSAPTNSGVTCSVDSLAVGSATVVTIVAQVGSWVAGGTELVNIGAVLASTPDPDLTNNVSQVSLMTAEPVADVTLTKTASPATVVAGTNLTYTMTATNWGPSDATVVQVVDTLPSTLSPVNASTDRGACTIAGQTVTCLLGDLPAGALTSPPTAGASAAVNITVRVSEDATGPTITNTATATTTSTDPDLSNNSDTATVDVDTEADLVVTKTASITGIPAATAHFEYTIIVTNNGPSAAHNATLTDLIPIEFDLDPASPPTLPAGVTCDADLSLDTATHNLWTCELGDVGVGPANALVITLPMVAAVTAGGPVTETVEVDADNETDYSNNTASWLHTGAPVADLSITKVPTTNFFEAGKTGVFEITVTNEGPSPSVATVSDTLPAGLTFLPGAPTSPECSLVGAVIECADPAGVPLDVGDSVTYTIQVGVSADLLDGDVITNTATVDGSIDDPALSNNTSTVTVPIRAQANLTVTQAQWLAYNGPGAAPNPGDVITETTAATMAWVVFTIENTGDATAYNSSILVDTDLPAYGVSTDMEHPVLVWNNGAAWVDDDSGCGIVAGQLMCMLNNGVAGSTLQPGDEVRVAILMLIRDDAPIPTAGGAAWVNASTTTPESDPDDNYGIAPLDITTGISELSILKSAVPGPGPGGALIAGTSFSYTITVWQERDAALATQGINFADALSVAVSDQLPVGFHAAQVNSTQGTCTINATNDRQFDCSLGTIKGTLSSPQPVTITVSGTLDQDVEGVNIPNTATATTTSDTYTVGPFASTAYVDVVRQADLQLVKEVDPSTMLTPAGLPDFLVGNSVGYTLTVFNAGPSAVGTSTVTDTLPIGLTLDTASSPGCSVTTPMNLAANTSEQISCAIPALLVGQSFMFRVMTLTSPFDIRLPGTGPGCVPGAPSLPWDITSPPNPANCDQYFDSYPRTIENQAVVAQNAPAVTDPDMTNNTASVQAALDKQVDVAVTASVSTTTPAAGQIVTYTGISINWGPSVADTPTAIVDFPPGFEPVDGGWDIPGMICDKHLTGGVPDTWQLTCDAIPVPPLFLVFEPGQAVTNVIQVQIADDTPPGTYTTSACSLTTTTDINPSNNCVAVDVYVQQVADTEIVKTLVTPNPLVVGENATYTLTVTNHGPSMASDVVISDTVPEGMSFVSAVNQFDDPCLVPEERVDDEDFVIKCSMGDLDATESATATIVLKVDSPSSLTELCNIGVVGSGASDPISNNNESEACADVVPAPAPVIEATKSVTPANAILAAGDQLTYRLDFENTGNLQGDIDYIDDLSDVLDDATLGAITTSSVGVTAVMVPGTTDLEIHGILQPSDTAWVEYVVTVLDDGQRGNSRLFNAAFPSTTPDIDRPDINEPPATCPVCTWSDVAGLTLAKDASPDTVTAAGQDITYTYTVENVGSVTVENLMINETGFTGEGTLDAIVCAATTLDPGDVTTCTVIYTTVADDMALTTIDNTATASGEAEDAAGNTVDVESNADTASVDVDPFIGPPAAPDIHGDKSVNPGGSIMMVGDQLTYRLEFDNTGNAAGDIDFIDDLSDVLDDASLGVITTSDVGVTADLVPGTTDLEIHGILQPTGTAWVEYVVTILPADQRGNSQLFNATFPSTTPDIDRPNITTDPPDCDACTWTDTAELTLVKEASPDTVTAAGQDITYTYTVENVGSVTVENLMINETGFTGEGTLGAIVCAATTLDPGDSTTCTVIYTTVDDDMALTTIDNTATAIGEAEDAAGNTVDVESNADTASVDVEPFVGPPATPDIQGAKVVDPADAVVMEGDTVTYTLSFVNNGTGAGDIDFIDDLSDVVDDAVMGAITTSDPAITADFDAVTGEMAIHGILQPGDDAWVSYAVTVLPDGQRGNSVLFNAAFPSTTPIIDRPDITTDPPDCEACTWTDVAGLTVVKDASVNTVTAAGQDIIYAYTVTNVGSVPVENIAINETGFTGEGTLGAIVCMKTALDPGDSTVCIVIYTTVADDMALTTIDNTATATGEAEDPQGNTVDVESNEDSVSVDVEPFVGPPATPDIQGAKVVDPADAVVMEGDTVTYTLSFVNNGTGAGDIDFIDDLSDVVDDAVMGAITTSDPAVTADFDAVTSEMSIHGILQPGDDAWVSYAVSVLPDGQRGNSVLFNAAFPSTTPITDRPDITTDPPDCEACTWTDVAGLTLVKDASPDTVTAAGQDITYTFEVTNSGSVAIEDVAINDGGFTGTGTLPPIVCSVADIAPGQTVSCSTTYTTVAADMDLTQIDNTATASGVAIDAQGAAVDVESNESSATVIVEPFVGPPGTPDVQGVKEVDAGNGIVMEGDEVFYTLTFTNNGTGEGDIDFIDDLSDVVDDASLGAITTSPGVTATFDVTTEEMAIHGVLQPGDSGWVKYLVIVLPDDQRGNSTLFNAAFPGDIPVTDRPDITTDPPDCEACTWTDVAGLSLVKEANPLTVTGVGNKVVYTYVVTNTGSIDVTDLVINETQFTGKGTLAAATCAETTLAPGESTTCTTTYIITQADMKLKTIENTAEASGVVTSSQGVVEDITSNSSSATVTVKLPPGPVTPSGGTSLPATPQAAPLAAILLGLGVLIRHQSELKQKE